MFSCEKCGRIFRQKNYLHLHLKRKTPCIPNTQSIIHSGAGEINERIIAHEETKNVLSLFSGGGGDSFGFKEAGWNITHYSENNSNAIKTHQTCFPDTILLKNKDGTSTDIRKIEDDIFKELKGKIHLIFAGFPCQGFSHAGKKKQDDPRNELVHEFVRATKWIEPEWIIGENVKGLLSRKGVFPPDTPERPIIDIITELFKSIGYTITYRIIDAREVGVPQIRKRLILIGHKGLETYPYMPWDRLLKIPEKLSIRNILEPTLKNAMELPELYKPSEKSKHYWIETHETHVFGKPHPNLERLVSGKRNLSTKEKREQEFSEKETVEFIEPKGLISFGVRNSGYHGEILDPDSSSKTIICAYNQCPRLFVGLYNPIIEKYWIRCLTVEECSQIQGFPKGYIWEGTEKEQIVQIGNAVPPPLAKWIGENLHTITFHEIPQIDSGKIEEEEGGED
jgi:DNA (cytosine-5)-methyltransferase 1